MSLKHKTQPVKECYDAVICGETFTVCHLLVGDNQGRPPWPGQTYGRASVTKVS